MLWMNSWTPNPAEQTHRTVKVPQCKPAALPTFCLHPALMQASVHHPLWNGGRRCYNRFFGWAWGDGALILMYPHLTFLSAPNSAELCCALLLLSAATTAITLLLWSVVQASRLLDTSSFASVGLAAGVTWRASTALLAAALAYKAADLVLDVVRAFSAVGRDACTC